MTALHCREEDNSDFVLTSWKQDDRLIYLEYPSDQLGLSGEPEGPPQKKQTLGAYAFTTACLFLVTVVLIIVMSLGLIDDASLSDRADAAGMGAASTTQQGQASFAPLLPPRPRFRTATIATSTVPVTIRISTPLTQTATTTTQLVTTATASVKSTATTTTTTTTSTTSSTSTTRTRRPTSTTEKRSTSTPVPSTFRTSSPASSATTVSTSTPIMTTKTKTRRVNTSLGWIAGKIEDVAGTRVVAFEGIPCAEDMGKENRFQSSKMAKPWSNVYDAIHTGPSCYQAAPLAESLILAGAAPSEDCISLNVWVPECAIYAGTGENCSPLTTVVYFHGGDLRWGSNSMPFYSGKVLSALGNLIVVVPNYRLGALGFLRHSIPGTKTSAGLSEQVLALDFVHKNAEALGGRRDDLVVYGHDWGAYTAGLFLLSPELQRRYGIKKAILGSGSPLMLPPLFDAKKQWSGFLKQLGCKVKPLLPCLVAAKPADVVAAQERYPGSVAVVHPHQFLSTAPREFLSFHSPNYSGAQVLLTSTSLEGFYTYYRKLGHSHHHNVTFDSTLDAIGLNEDTLTYLELLILQQDLATYYKIPPGDRADLHAFAIEFYGDLLYNCPSMLFADRMCSLGAEVTHVIVDQRPFSWNPLPVHQSRPSHLDDVYFIFGAYFNVRSEKGKQDPFDDKNIERDAKYARKLVSIVASFAKDGSVSAFRDKGYTGYCAKQQSIMLEHYVRVVPSWRKKQCAVNNKHFNYINALS